MKRDTILRKNASQTFKKLRGTDWVVERMYQVLSQGKRAFDSLMLEMGRMVAEAIMYIERSEKIIEGFPVLSGLISDRG